MQNEKRIIFIIKRLKALTSHSKTSLNYRTPFQLLIAAKLSAQSTNIIVKKAVLLFLRTKIYEASGDVFQAVR